jgi:adenosine deaminase
MMAILVEPEACFRIAYENVEDAYNESLDYVELRFSPWFMSETHQLDPQEVVEAVVDGVQSGSEEYDIRANLIGIISRTYGPDTAYRELDALLGCREQIVGLDLAGDEANWPAEHFVDHFRKAREVGWHVTVHAGESSGPESVWQAIDVLHAERIGHAVHAARDARLLDHMLDNHIGIEVSLTSNVQTSTIPNYRSSPLKQFLQRGLLATINTDDPGVSGIDLRHEYEIAAPAAGLTADEICQAQHNALEIAFLTDREKQDLMDRYR